MDGRDIMFFRCEDLENYVHEVNVNKGNYIVINKADLLREDIRLIKYNKIIMEWIFKQKINKSYIFFRFIRIIKDWLGFRKWIASYFIYLIKFSYKYKILTILLIERLYY